ncbi:DNA-binding protein BIN4-like isoform X1 [Wolffia australiana]
MKRLKGYIKKEIWIRGSKNKENLQKALVVCDDESVDLSGDVGAVGRVVISETGSRSHEMLLDLKGTIYKTAIVPSRTFCVVSFGPSEAKVEAIMSDFIQLKPHSNLFEAETVIEGVLDGFSFDMDDEREGDPKSSAFKGAKGGENDDHPDEKNQGKSNKKMEGGGGGGAAQKPCITTLRAPAH